MTGFAGLFRKFILRRLGEERLRSAVTVLGIALGVAVVVAIQLTNASSVRGFETAIETVSGKTSLEVVAPGPGFDETELTEFTTKLATLKSRLEKACVRLSLDF